MLGLVVLIVAILALRHPTSKSTGGDTTSPSHTASSPAPSSAHTSSAPATHPTTKAGSSSAANAGAKAIPIVILNNTKVTHLAADAAALFTQAGWKVTSYGNYTNNILSTCAYYDPNVAGAKAAATLLQSEFPDILRIKPKFSGLAAGPIVVVLTSNFKTA